MSGSDFQTDDSAQKKKDKKHPGGGESFFEENDSRDDSSQSSDACPDSVRSPQGEGFGRLRQEKKAENHSHNG